METQGKGGVLATKAVETQGKGTVLAAKAVETQGKGGVLRSPTFDSAIPPVGLVVPFGPSGVGASDTATVLPVGLRRPAEGRNARAFDGGNTRKGGVK